MTWPGTLCRARKTALQGMGKAEPHRRSAPGGRASGAGGSYAGGGVRAGLGLGGAGAGEALPTRGSSPALTHGLLRNTFEADGSSTPGALYLYQRNQNCKPPAHAGHARGESDTNTPWPSSKT